MTFGATAAQAAVTGPDAVRPGSNITVFHNIDFVAAFGHQVGGQTQVDVFRGDHRIATASGPAVSTPEGGALEVNHGVEGVPAGPGDCWDGATPDIRPGDRIRVSNPGGRAGADEVIVDEMSIDTMSRMPGTDLAPGTADDEVWVQGVARSGADGSPIAIEILDSGEFRDPLDGQLRMEPNEVVAGPDPGTYIAKYHRPFNFVKGAVTDQEALSALMRDGHAFGYGHVPLPSGALRPDAMLVEGSGEANGPALGCEASAPHASSVGTMSADALNIVDSAPDAADLVVGGWAAGHVDSAQVELSNDAVSTSKAADLTGGPGARGWSARFTQAELAELGDGTLTARLTVGGTPVGAVKTIRRDTVAPAAPSMTPNGGTHTGRQAVDLAAESGARIHYTTDGSTPTTASTRFGAQIVIDRDATVKAIAVDAAGNASPVASASFTITAAAVTAPARSAVPGVGVLGTSASLAPGLAAAPVTLKVRRLSLPARMSAAAARRQGLVASFVTPSGAAYAEARLIRLDGAKRRLVGKRLTAARPGKRQVARFTSAAIRRQLAAGRYVLEVRTGPSAGRLGPAITRRLRVGG